MPRKPTIIRINASTGEQDWDGKEEGLCYCGATFDEHEAAFMNYYLFRDRDSILFPEGSTSQRDMYADHYFMLLDYLAESPFVQDVHREYFAKQRDLHEQRSSESQDLFSSLFEKRDLRRTERYASCAPRSGRHVMARQILHRVLNGPHAHRFYRTIGGLRCAGCGAEMEDTHDLGDEDDMVYAHILSFGSRPYQTKVFPHGCCARCGRIPDPFWVSRGRRRLRSLRLAWFRFSEWCRAHGQRPLVMGIILMLIGAVLGAVLSTMLASRYQTGQWWPF